MRAPPGAVEQDVDGAVELDAGAIEVADLELALAGGDSASVTRR